MALVGANTRLPLRRSPLCSNRYAEYSKQADLMSYGTAVVAPYPAIYLISRALATRNPVGHEDPLRKTILAGTDTVST